MHVTQKIIYFFVSPPQDLRRTSLKNTPLLFIISLKYPRSSPKWPAFACFALFLLIFFAIRQTCFLRTFSLSVFYPKTWKNCRILLKTRQFFHHTTTKGKVWLSQAETGGHSRLLNSCCLVRKLFRLLRPRYAILSSCVTDYTIWQMQLQLFFLRWGDIFLGAIWKPRKWRIFRKGEGDSRQKHAGILPDSKWF